MNFSRGRVVVAAQAIVLAVALTACASGGGPGSGSGTGAAPGKSSAAPLTDIVPANSTDHAPTSSLCGTKPLKLAFLWPFPTTFATQAYAEIQDEASACSNVKVDYLNANGDQQKDQANLQSVVAQGYDGVVVYSGWPESALNGITAAYKQGIAVVPVNMVVGGAAGQNYSSKVVEDLKSIGVGDADWIGEQLDGKGTVAYLGGPAGDSYAVGIFNAFKERLKKFPGITIATDNAVATDWSAANTQQAMAGLLSRFTIDGVVTDYGAATTGVLQAYAKAGKPLPPITTDSTDNQFTCTWLKQKGPDSSLRSTEGTIYAPRIGLRKVLAAINKSKDDESGNYALFPNIDTTDGHDPKCVPDLPPGADLSGGLSEDQLKKVLSN